MNVEVRPRWTPRNTTIPGTPQGTGTPACAQANRRGGRGALKNRLKVGQATCSHRATCLAGTQPQTLPMAAGTHGCAPKLAPSNQPPARGQTTKLNQLYRTYSWPIGIVTDRANPPPNTILTPIQRKGGGREKKMNWQLSRLELATWKCTATWQRGALWLVQLGRAGSQPPPRSPHQNRLSLRRAPQHLTAQARLNNH